MDIVSLVVGILGTLLGGSGLVSFFMLRQEKKSRDLDNEIKAISEWQEIASAREEEIADLRSRLDQKNDQLFTAQEKVSETRSLLDDVNTQLAKCRIMRCQRLNCPKRLPPLGASDLTKQDLDDMNIDDDYLDDINREIRKQILETPEME